MNLASSVTPPDGFAQKESVEPKPIGKEVLVKP